MKTILGLCLAVLSLACHADTFPPPKGGGANYDPQYFKTNSSSGGVPQIGFIVQNLSVDTRPTSIADLKQVTPPSNTLYVLFTNSGPCTITSIHLDYTPEQFLPSPILSFFVDGVSNGCQATMFFAAAGSPMLAFHGDSIDLSSAPGVIAPVVGSGMGAFRKVYINAKTNASVCINFYTNVTMWSDIGLRVGTPVTGNSWHVTEAQGTTSAAGTFSISAIAGKIGQLESLSMFALANSQAYLESRPTIYIDSNLPILANGTEDFFGGSWYWNNGLQAYGTPHWGNQANNYLLNRYGFAYANMSYRFWDDAFFNTGLVANYTNGIGSSISNDFLLTYWTTP